MWGVLKAAFISYLNVMKHIMWTSYQGKGRERWGVGTLWIGLNAVSTIGLRFCIDNGFIHVYSFQGNSNLCGPMVSKQCPGEPPLPPPPPYQPPPSPSDPSANDGDSLTFHLSLPKWCALLSVDPMRDQWIKRWLSVDQTDEIQVSAEAHKIQNLKQFQSL
jgi:hypothetical protein